MALSFIEGNEAIGRGAIAAGCRFFGGYPITPASEILHELARLKRFDVRTIQAEDEIAAIAFAIRALPYHYVFAKGRVFFIDNDAYYHLRRIVYAVERFPDILVRDPYLGFPESARAIWPPYLDGAIG